MCPFANINNGTQFILLITINDVNVLSKSRKKYWMPKWSLQIHAIWKVYTGKRLSVMAHSHCTGPGTGTRPGPGPGMMGLYIMNLTVHTTLRQRQWQVTGPGANGLHTCFPVSQSQSQSRSKLLLVASVTGEGAKLLVHEHKIEYTFRGRHSSLNFNVTLCMNKIIDLYFLQPQ